MADKPTSTVNFRKLLLNRCQKEFEKDKVNDDVFEKKQRELEAAASVSPVYLKRLSLHFSIYISHRLQNLLKLQRMLQVDNLLSGLNQSLCRIFHMFMWNIFIPPAHMDCF